MCGIVGILSPRRQAPSRRRLQEMTDTMEHRGPDGSGVWTAPGVGLGHRRLSIVDLSGGAQPMASADGRLVVTFNGEIYNHGALRGPLEAAGETFRTRSDTEVLLAGWRQWGDALPTHLNGMFAFCLWDTTRQVALLARDRMGKKPLYYAHLPDGTLLFASEVKALLKHPAIQPTIDPTALALYLTHEYVPGPWSAFRGLRKLPPGHLMRWEQGRIAVEPYWRIPFGEPSALRGEAEWSEALRDALSRAVERRLMSDVPLGVFLSGGIDSSAVTALMTEYVPAEQIRTFSIAFEDPSFDESRWARRVADYLGTHHTEEVFSVDALLESLPTLVRQMDEPFADASLLPTWLLSRFTRQHVTVALGGDGGDELFAGYETFRAEEAAQWYRLLPAPARHLLRQAVGMLPVRTGNFSLDFVLKRFVQGADAPDELRHTRWLSSFLPGSPLDPLNPDLRAQVPEGEVWGVMARPFLECPDPRRVNRLSYAYMTTYMVEDILTKVDRASMAASLEVRSPFLDTEVVSLAARMPPELKINRRWVAKYILKRALRRDLPHDILHRKKKGFGIPVATWLKGPLRDRMRELLDAERLRQAGIFDPRVVERLMTEHLEGRADHRKGLWTLMMFEQWREHYGAHL
jgi:asparagine synthase (glutamine-hydrolysing)